MIRNSVRLLSFVFLLAACQQQPQYAVSYDGQETHGGDISVAMLRASVVRLTNNERLFLSQNPSEKFKNYFASLSKKSFVSFEGSTQDKLFFEGPEFVEVNRNRVMQMDVRDLGLQLAATYYQVPAIFNMTAVMHWNGEAITPNHVKERAGRLMDQLKDCIVRARQSSDPYMLAKLTPHLRRLAIEDRFDELRNVEVAYASTKLIDVKTKRRVDMGVTLNGVPQILLDKERVAEWRTSNFATDYLIFHEYSHILKRKMNSEDSDFALSSELFSLCTLGGTWQFPELLHEDLID